MEHSFFISFSTTIFLFFCFLGVWKGLDYFHLFIYCAADQANVSAWCLCWWILLPFPTQRAGTHTTLHLKLYAVKDGEKKISHLAKECSESWLWYVFWGDECRATLSVSSQEKKSTSLRWWCYAFLPLPCPLPSLFLSFGVCLHSLAAAMCHTRNRKKGQSLGISHQQPPSKEFYFQLPLRCRHSEKLHFLTLKCSRSGPKWIHLRVFCTHSGV